MDATNRIDAIGIQCASAAKQRQTMQNNAAKSATAAEKNRPTHRRTAASRAETAKTAG